MPHIFRIHKTGSVNLKNWSKSRPIVNEDISSIPDTVHQGSATKLGASIPSPFARLYLFDTAFQMVLQKKLVGNTMFHQLVSDCLDLFQFLFLLGDHPNITYVNWEKEAEIDNMLRSTFKEHQQLGKAMRLFFEGKKFKDLNRITLIYYKNKLVGGTSPITVLYTSPNWKRIILENNWTNDFKTSGTDILFDDVPYAIHQRDEAFIKYMYRFVYTHNTILSKQSEAFFNYFARIRRENARIDELLEKEGIAVNYNAKQFQNDYAPIKLNPHDDSSKEMLYSGACVLLKPKAEKTTALIQGSDFLIANTVDHFSKKTDANGTLLNIQKPLVLIKGNHKLNYINSNWDERTTVPDVPSIALHKRKLPDSNFSYPYLTTGDFLEETLIETAFNINSERFFTGFRGNFRFLLPIKKNYFNFFTIEDLKKQLTILQNGDIVKVELKVPLVNGRHIEFSRSFDLNNEDHVIRQQGISNAFNLGIFPFYQITDEPALNQYEVGVVSNIADMNLHFYQYPDIVNEKSLVNQQSIRTPQKGIGYGSRYFQIEKKNFDLIEISIGQVVSTQGLIIPNWTKIENSNRRKAYTFAIDFGTTNTYIAYSNNRNKIEEFSVEEKDQQMVLLSEIATQGKTLNDRIEQGAGRAAATIDYFNREFVPSFIGNGSQFYFPSRTTICEQESYTVGSPKLFHNINNGYFLELDGQAVSTGEYQYYTDLKWSMDKKRLGKEKERVEAYLRQTLWLIKNKIVLNSGSMKATIIWMVPMSMKKRIRSTFEAIWQEQVIKVFGNNPEIELKRKYESITPYYGLQHEGAQVRRKSNVLNIDIGGGTTDIFFIYKKTEKFYSTSCHFAGNDLWGEGLSEAIRHDNGFLLMMEEYIEKNLEALNGNHALAMSVYDSFMNESDFTSADICSLLFRYDDVFKFSDQIRNHEPLSSLLILHLSAILYHIARIIDLKDLDLPDFISFTGKGSLYLRLITTDSKDLSDMVMQMLEVFSGKEAPFKAEAILADEPKRLTANGAIAHEYSNERIEIDENTENLLHHGFSASSQLDPLAEYTVAKLEDLESAHQAHFIDYLDKMKSQKISRLLREMEISFRFGSTEALEELNNYAQDSYEEMVYRLKDVSEEQDLIEESPFFWYFKDSLYRLSQDLQKLNS